MTGGAALNPEDTSPTPSRPSSRCAGTRQEARERLRAASPPGNPERPSTAHTRVAEGHLYVRIRRTQPIKVETMNITVTPAGRGRFHARLGDRLITTSYTPFFSAARILKEEGVHWSEPLTMTHEGSETICMTSTVGEASRLTVQDNDKGLTLRPYQPNPFGRPE